MNLHLTVYTNFLRIKGRKFAKNDKFTTYIHLWTTGNYYIITKFLL